MGGVIDTFGIRGTIDLMVARSRERNRRPGKITRVRIKKLDCVIHVRSLTSDFGLLRDFFWANNDLGRMYDIDFSDYDIEPVRSIVDAGANIGLFTLLFAKRFPLSKFYCIEPEKGNFMFLKRNTASLKNVKLYHCGLWQKCCPLEVTTTPLSSGTVGYVVRESVGDQDNSLRGIDIPTLMKMNGLDEIDILKMDIEGSEFPIFLYGSYESWIDKVKVLIIEIHDDYYENGTRVISDLMKEHGFDMKKANEDIVFIKSALRKRS